MKQVIHKFPFEIEDRFELSLPAGASILFIEKQRKYEYMPGPEGRKVETEVPCMWCTVDPEEERKEIRTFEIVGTGHEFNSKGRRYIGSLMMASDTLLWHVFEIVIPGAL